MEFSKKWMIGSVCAGVVCVILNCCGILGSEVTMAVMAEITASAGFYFWKAKNENRAKYAQKYMTKWAEKYGPETAARIAEIVLKE